MQFTLLTLNLAGYKNWADREVDVVTTLNQVNADIIFLQEVKYDLSISPLTQARYINTLLARPYEHSVSDVPRFYAPSTGAPYREGLAILSRFPLYNPETLALTKAADDKHTRIIQTATTIIGDTTVNLANVHFSNNNYSVDQLGETLGLLSARETEAVIAGDFNIFDINDQREIFDGKYIVSTDAEPYISFPSENATLDYMLLPKKYRFMSIKTFAAGSDHLGIMASIEI